jgi:hypothetical protein
MRKIITKWNIIFLIVFILILFGFIYYFNFSKPKPKCDWIITNCCTENAGAYWECVNVNNYTPKINCSEVFVVCPQVLSPKPKLKCIYDEMNKTCVVR